MVATPLVVQLAIPGLTADRQARQAGRQTGEKIKLR